MSSFLSIQNDNHKKAERREINDLLSLILRDYFADSSGKPDLQWSLSDFINLFNTFTDNDDFRTLDFGQFRSESRGNYMIRTVKKLNNEKIFEHPCTTVQNNTPEFLFNFCQNFKSFQLLDGNRVRNLMMKTIGRQHDGLPGGKLGTIPFCFQNEEVKRFKENISQSSFPFPKNTKNYGYKFCIETNLTVTDIGICTTFNGAGIFGQKKQSDYDAYSSQESYAIYEHGIFLLLDSLGYKQNFGEQHSTYSMNLGRKFAAEVRPYNRRNTITEGGDFMEFHVLVHAYNEIPQFLGKRPLKLEANEKSKNSLAAREAFVKFSASGKIMEKTLKDQFPVEKRNCRFEDEMDGLNLAF